MQENSLKMTEDQTCYDVCPMGPATVNIFHFSSCLMGGGGGSKLIWNVLHIFQFVFIQLSHSPQNSSIDETAAHRSCSPGKQTWEKIQTSRRCLGKFFRIEEIFCPYYRWFHIFVEISSNKISTNVEEIIYGWFTTLSLNQISTK